MNCYLCYLVINVAPFFSYLAHIIEEEKSKGENSFRHDVFERLEGYLFVAMFLKRLFAFCKSKFGQHIMSYDNTQAEVKVSVIFQLNL